MGGDISPFWRKIGKRENRQWSLPRIMDDGWGRRETGPWSIASRIVPTKLMHMYARSFFAKYRIGRFHAYPGFLPRLFRVKRATRTQELKICFVAVGFYVLSFPPWFFFLLCLVVRKTVRRPKSLRNGLFSRYSRLSTEPCHIKRVWCKIMVSHKRPFEYKTWRQCHYLFSSLFIMHQSGANTKALH